MDDSGYTDHVSMDTVTMDTPCDSRCYEDWNQQDESGIDLLCREDASLWTPSVRGLTVNSTGRACTSPVPPVSRRYSSLGDMCSPTSSANNPIRKICKARRKLGRLDKKKVHRTPLRRSERLRNKSRSSSVTTPSAERPGLRLNSRLPRVSAARPSTRSRPGAGSARGSIDRFRDSGEIFKGSVDSFRDSGDIFKGTGGSFRESAASSRESVESLRGSGNSFRGSRSSFRESGHSFGASGYSFRKRVCSASALDYQASDLARNLAKLSPYNKPDPYTTSTSGSGDDSFGQDDGYDTTIVSSCEMGRARSDMLSSAHTILSPCSRSADTTLEFAVSRPCFSPSDDLPDYPESPSYSPPPTPSQALNPDSPLSTSPDLPRPFTGQPYSPPCTPPLHHSTYSDQSHQSHQQVPPEWSHGPDGDGDMTPQRRLALMVIEYDNYGFMDYQTEIYLHKRACELRYHPIDSLTNQSQVTPGMRAVLAEWLTKIHHSLELKFDTLFLTMNLVDRFLVTTPIASSCVQLLGLTAVLIASKMNEIFPPTIPELLNTSCEKYSKDQLRQLERLVLVRLKFDLLAPTSIYFLEHYAADRINPDGSSTRGILKARMLARYLLELSLQDYSLVQFQPSVLGLVALDQSENLLRQNTRQLPLTAFGHAPSTVIACVAEFQPIVDGLATNEADLEAIIDRYTLVFGSPDDPCNK